MCCTEISSREAWGKLSAFDSVQCLPSQIDAHVPRNGGMRHSHGGKEQLLLLYRTNYKLKYVAGVYNRTLSSPCFVNVEMSENNQKV